MKGREECTTYRMPFRTYSSQREIIKPGAILQCFSLHPVYCNMLLICCYDDLCSSLHLPAFLKGKSKQSKCLNKFTEVA